MIAQVCLVTLLGCVFIQANPAASQFWNVVPKQGPVVDPEAVLKKIKEGVDAAINGFATLAEARNKNPEAFDAELLEMVRRVEKQLADDKSADTIETKTET